MHGNEFLASHHERGDRAFHVRGAAAVNPAIAHDGVKRIVCPLVARARWHHIGVPGEDQQRAARTPASPEVGDAAFGEGLCREADWRKMPHEDPLALPVVGGDGRLGDQIPDQAKDEGFGHYALSRSLMLVLARVWASTRLTMTAQARLCEPSAAGSDPGTTTDPDGTRP